MFEPNSIINCDPMEMIQKNTGMGMFGESMTSDNLGNSVLGTLKSEDVQYSSVWFHRVENRHSQGGSRQEKRQ